MYRPSVNLPGAAGHLRTSQMCAALNHNSVDAPSNPPAAMLPMNHFLGAMSGTRHSFGPLNQDRPRHEPLVLSSVPCTTTREPPFLLGPSQESHLQSLQLTVAAEVIVLLSAEHKLAMNPIPLQMQNSKLSVLPIYNFSLVFLSLPDDLSRGGNVKASAKFNPRDHLRARLEIVINFK